MDEYNTFWFCVIVKSWSQNMFYREFASGPQAVFFFLQKEICSDGIFPRCESDKDKHMI